jgi:hypothetical protein
MLQELRELELVCSEAKTVMHLLERSMVEHRAVNWRDLLVANEEELTLLQSLEHHPS